MSQIYWRRCWRTDVIKTAAKPIRCDAFVLSDYAEKLTADVKSKYIQNISDIQTHLLLIPAKKLSEECLPPVECTDLLSYLVLDTSFYTNAQFKVFRSLQAYNQMVSGFISCVHGYIVKFCTETLKNHSSGKGILAIYSLSGQETMIMVS